MVKLVVSDLDGTLLDDKKEISPENKKAIRLLQDNGINFCICTGRIYMSAFLLGEELQNDFPIVCCNGALIKNPKTGEVLFSDGVDIERASKVADVFEKYGLTYHFYNEDTVFSNKMDRSAKYFYEKYKHTDIKPIRVVVESTIKERLKGQKTIYKFIAFSDRPEDKIQALNELVTIDGIDITQSAEDNIEVVKTGVSKGAAVRVLKERYGYSDKEMMVLGDQLNDLSMFRESYYSVAVENGDEELKKEAYYITKTNDQDGVAHAIERIVFAKGE